MQVTLKAVRGAFLNVFEAKTVNGEGDPRFSGTFVIVPGGENAKLLDKAVNQVAAEKWKDKAAVVLKKLIAEGRICFQKKEKTNSDGEVYDGFEGSYSISGSNTARPLVIGRDRSPLTQADGKIYSGCFVNVMLDVWPQDNQYGRRVNAKLLGLQFAKDGDAFGGGAPAKAEDFEDLSVEEPTEDIA